MITKENVGKVCIINNKEVSAENLDRYSVDDYFAFYEVIRVIKGAPLFYDDHYTRLKSSMQKSNFELGLTKKDLKDEIHRLCDANGIADCNVKVMIMQNHAEQNVLLFLSKFYYPSKQEYNFGVKCCFAHIKRDNPNIKIINTNYKETVKNIIDEKNVFEALLVNDNGKVTEGSRSNVFFVKGKKIYTSPQEYVLMGITRQYVIDVCTKLGYEVIETLIGIDVLKSLDAVFITGTSINVLPVASIDEYEFNSSIDATTVDVMSGYDSLVAAILKDS